MLLLKTSKLNNSFRRNIKLVLRKMKALIGIEEMKITNAPSFGKRLLKKELQQKGNASHNYPRHARPGE